MEEKYLKGMIPTTILLSTIMCGVIVGIMVFLDKQNLGTFLGVNLQHDWFSLISTCISMFVSINVPIFVMVKTLRNQKENADRELRIKIMPIFQYEILLDEEVPFEKRGGLTVKTKDELEYENSIFHNVFIKITNIGAGHAKECYIDIKRDGFMCEKGIFIGNSGIKCKEMYEETFLILDEQNADNDVIYNWRFEIRYKDYIENEYIQDVGVYCGYGVHIDEYDNRSLKPCIGISTVGDPYLMSKKISKKDLKTRKLN